MTEHEELGIEVPIEIELDQEQIDKLKDGEKVEFLLKIRDPIREDKDPQSINTLKMTWQTKGVYGDELIEEAFPMSRELVKFNEYSEYNHLRWLW